MTTATAPSASKPAASMTMTAVYAALFTAIVAIAFVLLFSAGILWLWIPAFLLYGAGPVVGYQFATGKLGSDWKSILGGVLGFILLPLGFLLWPILVGLMTKGQSVGRLFLWSLLGFVLGAVVWLIIGTLFGQDPIWVGPGWVVGWAVWGAFAGAAMLNNRAEPV